MGLDWLVFGFTGFSSDSDGFGWVGIDLFLGRGGF